MSQERHTLYKALTARDPRFDGVFFVGVTSTGIYCRPICPVKTPKEANCRFFHSPQEAEQEGFRACLRCRPELAPGSAPVDDAQRIAELMVQRIEEGAIGNNDEGLEGIADQFELSSRQIRRIIQKELGVPPIQLILTRRLLLAKQLLTETGFAGYGHCVCQWVFEPAALQRCLRRPLSDGAFAAAQASVEWPGPWDRRKHIDSATFLSAPRMTGRGCLHFLRTRELKGVEAVTR